MEQLNSLISNINGVVWGPPMLILLGLTALFLSIGLSFMPWRKIGYAFHLLRTDKSDQSDGEIKPFAALMTAMSATVGTGNIAGVAIAITMGGPGAIFYMWVIALFGMATKYAEAVCAVSYRETDNNGHYIGGPMYYLKNGVGAKLPTLGKTLGAAFAIFGITASFGIGNGAQIHSMSQNMLDTFNIPTIATGFVFATLVAFVIFGGIQRIAEVATKLVPSMIVLYIGSGVIILLINISKIPDAFSLIFTHAFNPIAATGGFAGAAVAAAIRHGVARGVFSNESGLGSAAIAHAAAKTNNPVRQGLIAMLGTFIDTIIVCTITALVILTSGLWTTGETAAVLTSNAFAQGLNFGFGLGKYIVTISLVVFAFTTLLGWSYYGERCWQYLFNTQSIILYRIAWVIAIAWFANQKVDFVWNFSDTMNGLMAIPNLIGLIILSPMVFKVTKTHFAAKQ